MEALTAKQKSEEKYVSICFAILAELLSLGVSGDGEKSDAAAVKSEGGEEGGAAVTRGVPEELPDYCTPELTELLSDSCLLPAMASYLLNDSGKFFLSHSCSLTRLHAHTSTVLFFSPLYGC